MHSCAWKSILLKIRNIKPASLNLIDLLQVRIGDGESTKFWEDKWSDQGILKNLFPRLYALEAEKGSLVKNRIPVEVENWSRRRSIRGGREQEEAVNIKALLDRNILSDKKHVWIISGAPNDEYSTRWLRDCMETHKTMGQIQSESWNKWVPKKHNIFIWRLLKNRLPTRRNLCNMGVDVPCSLCPLCDQKEEDANHLFVECSISTQFWTKLGFWWQISSPSFARCEDPFVWSKYAIKNKKEGMWFQVTVIAVLVSIWKLRNGVIFDKNKVEIDREFRNKQMMSTSACARHVKESDRNEIWKETRNTLTLNGDHTNTEIILRPSGSLKKPFTTSIFTRLTASYQIGTPISSTGATATFLISWFIETMDLCVPLKEYVLRILSMNAVIGKLIGGVQSAYVANRNILDGPLVINELYSWAKSGKKKVLMFKVDFEKAFDSINWNYLESVMNQMGFESKWRQWIRGCLNSSWTSVIINGSPTNEFKISKGVRQGDPLSPFLFIIAMEDLNVAMETARDKGLFEGVHIPNGPTLTHLFYADDALFVGEWSCSNLKNLARILNCFNVVSGLKVNFHKSKVFGIGVAEDETSSYASILGCEAGQFPFNYLGVPVGANMNLKKNWKPIIDKFEAKLSPWKSKTLSFGGRLTLISSVLGNLPTYYLSLFKAPIAITEELEKIRRRFLWGGDKDKRKIHWVSWEKVTARKSDGGLGVSSIRNINTSLMVKWWWRLKQEKDSIWGKAIKGIHNLQDKPHDYLANKNITGVWKNITTARRELNAHGLEIGDVFNIILKSGDNTQFWCDRWLGSEPLKNIYPELFEKEARKQCTVADRFFEGSFAEHWTSQMEEDGLDQWRCTLDPSGDYSVRALRHKIEDQRNLTGSLPPFTWHKTSPIKVNCFIWRAMQQRIASAVALKSRGIESINTSCSACVAGQECSDHLLIKCTFASEVRKKVFAWCGIQHVEFSSVSDLLSFVENWAGSPSRKKSLMTISHSLLWTLWRLRNDRIFNGEILRSLDACKEGFSVEEAIWVGKEEERGMVSDGKSEKEENADPTSGLRFQLRHIGHRRRSLLWVFVCSIAMKEKGQSVFEFREKEMNGCREKDGRRDNKNSEI
ncbi:hypothetical protein LXL04_029825 [Taraxacum kok-saghyz]